MPYSCGDWGEGSLCPTHAETGGRAVCALLRHAETGGGQSVPYSGMRRLGEGTGHQRLHRMTWFKQNNIHTKYQLKKYDKILY